MIFPAAINLLFSLYELEYQFNEENQFFNI